MTLFFLKAKHWQVFFLLFGMFFVTSFAGTPSMLHPDMMKFTFAPNSTIAILITLLWFFLYFLWFASLSVGLQRYIPTGLRCKTSFLLFCLFYPVAYAAFIFIILFRPGQIFVPWVLGIIFPLHLFAMFCIFYCLYFSAKIIKTAEWQRKVTFGDFAGEFFLLWFFPVGIWFIQPKVNKIVG